MSYDSKHKTPSSIILDPNNAGYYPYWFDKGLRIAGKTAELLRTEGGLLYPNVLPATKMTLTVSSIALGSALNADRDISHLKVDDNEPVVKGFIEGMEVGTFSDLHLSPVLRDLGFLPVLNAVFNPGDYPESVSDHLNIVYLPAVLVDYSPTN